jgi:cell division protein ZapA
MSVKVSIYGTEYPVKGDADPSYIEEVAAYVDGKMREVARSLTVKSTTKVAVMAALNITDELFNARRDLEERERKLETEIERLAQKARQGTLAG